MDDSCSEIRNDLIRLAYGEEVDVTVRDHLRRCDACGAEARAVAEIVRALPEEPLPIEIRDRLVALGTAGTARASRALVLAAAAALLVGVGLTIAVRHAPVPERTPAEPVAAREIPSAKAQASQPGAEAPARSVAARSVRAAVSGALAARALPGTSRPAGGRSSGLSSSSDAWRAGVDVSLAAIGRRLRHLEDDRNFE